ncbi:hypothetical protein CASFOL_028204 [Castilleja foliolosa]|uniref:Uncharacterized protein n=1 Tax=Castilleja foliolosa TaxID=1961234 RepID=A0ABD3CEP6_9LAMI
MVVIEEGSPSNEGNFHLEPTDVVIEEGSPSNEGNFHLEPTDVVIEEGSPSNEGNFHLEPTDVVIEEGSPSNEGIENMEAENDAETVEVAENMWAQLLEKIVTESLAPEKTGHVDVVGPKQVDQSRDTLAKDTRTLKPSRKKTTVEDSITCCIDIFDFIEIHATVTLLGALKNYIKKN